MLAFARSLTLLSEISSRFPIGVGIK